MPIAGVIGGHYTITPVLVKHFIESVHRYGPGGSNTTPQTVNNVFFVNGDTIVVVVIATALSQTFTVTSPQLTFTLVQSATYFHMFSAPASASWANQTITITRTVGTASFTHFMWVTRNVSAVLARGSGTGATYTLTTGGGSLLFHQWVDFAGGAGYVYQPGSGTVVKRADYGDGTVYGNGVYDYVAIPQGTFTFGLQLGGLNSQICEAVSSKAAVAARRFKHPLGWGRSTASSTTLTIAVAAPIDFNDLVIVRVAFDNTGSGVPTVTCNDASGNIYSQQAFTTIGAAGTGIAGAIFVTRATVPMARNQLITITFSAAITAKAAYAESFIGFTPSLRTSTQTATGTSNAPTVTSGTGTAGDLVLSMVAAETGTPISSGASNIDGGDWSSVTQVNASHTGTDANLVQVAGQYKIITGTLTQTSAWLIGASTEWMEAIVVLIPG